MATDKQLFQSLDKLRESGMINLMGMRQFLQDTFELPPLRSSEVLQRWMRTLSIRHPLAHKKGGK